MKASSQPGKVLITGGVGFIGTNMALRLLKQGRDVVVLDNFSRKGVQRNADYLAHQDAARLEIVRGDCRDAALVRRLMRGVSEIFHFAAQVAVTTSLEDPISDFEVNAGGTLTVLEAAREQGRPPRVLFTSTNKVYGALGWLPLRLDGDRYRPVSDDVALSGISESCPLEFCSPYGCSKGAADQYVLDYAKSFGLPAAVFRMSCIYGPHQCGNADQGWVAHFMARVLANDSITIFGDGRQVRDLLFVEDLLDAMLGVTGSMDVLAGQAFNVGGGVANATSLLEVLRSIGASTGLRPRVDFEAPRVGDQRYYVSDIRKLSRALGWQPRVTVAEGLQRMREFLSAQLEPESDRAAAAPVYEPWESRSAAGGGAE